MSEPLPELLDVKAFRPSSTFAGGGGDDHAGVPIVQVPGLRKIYVRRTEWRA